MGYLGILATRGSPKLRGTFSGVPMIRLVVSWSLYCGPRCLEIPQKSEGLAGKR